MPLAAHPSASTGSSQARPSDAATWPLSQCRNRFAPWPSSAATFPPGVPMVKRVAAVAGDIACADGTTILVNGRAIVERRAQDPTGRPLPWWQGCDLLKSGEVLLLMPSVPNSFDGRYFGPVEDRDVIGHLVPLWTR